MRTHPPKIHNLPVTETRRRLPHLDIPGCAQFITFRLYGTLPANRIFTPQQVTTSGAAFASMDRPLDQAHCGPAFLKLPAIAKTTKDSIDYGVKLGNYQLHAWSSCQITFTS